MKSNKHLFCLIFTIISNLIILLIFIIGLVMTFSIDNYDKIDKNNFIKYMNEKRCSIIDLQKENKYPGIIDYLVTDKDNCKYLIKYITFNNKKAILDFFSDGKKDVIQNNEHITGTTSVSINSNQKYYEYSTSGDYYKIIVYKDNSILYASADKKYSNEVKNIFRDLHYQYEINFCGLKIMWCSLFVVLLIFIVSMWGTLKKTRDNGWISLIPFYNIGCLSKDILGSAFWALLLFVPIGNVVFIFMINYNIGKVFNKNSLYCFLMMFIPTVLWPLLAFDDSKYSFKLITKGR